MVTGLIAESKAEMWRAVEERDTTADGKFVFAVLTTGIYCRPSCPGRRPKKGNVAFYATPREAEEAGFRPCLRCKPRTPDSPQLAWVKRACAANPVSLLIPCHRVVGKKGDLQGYRWGLKRKRMLLEAERSEPSD